MKKVVFEKSISTINFEKITNESIVGIQWQNGRRTMVTKSQQGYIGVSDDNVYSAWGEPSKIDYIKRARKSGCHVFVFENHSELFKWMSEADFY
jgi:hypothetical protein